jgi:hypothetical protein
MVTRESGRYHLKHKVLKEGCHLNMDEGWVSSRRSCSCNKREAAQSNVSMAQSNFSMGVC